MLEADFDGHVEENGIYRTTELSGDGEEVTAVVPRDVRRVNVCDAAPGEQPQAEQIAQGLEDEMRQPLVSRIVEEQLPEKVARQRNDPAPRKPGRFA